MKASFNNIGSSQFQVRSFKNVSFRFPQSYGDVRFNTLLPSYGDVRCDTRCCRHTGTSGATRRCSYSSTFSLSRRCRTVRVRQVRQVVAVIEDVQFDTSLPQFVYVKLVKALPYSSSFKYVKPLQFSSCFVKALHSSQDIAARLWSIAYTVPVRLAGSNIRDHLHLRTFAKWFSLPTTD